MTNMTNPEVSHAMRADQRTSTVMSALVMKTIATNALEKWTIIALVMSASVRISSGTHHVTTKTERSIVNPITSIEQILSLTPANDLLV